MFHLSQLPNTAIAFIIGMGWAVAIFAIDRLQPLSFFEEDSWGYIGAHALIYGGVSGTFVHVTHTILSSFLYGMVGYLVVASFVFLWQRAF